MVASGCSVEWCRRSCRRVTIPALRVDIDGPEMLEVLSQPLRLDSQIIECFPFVLQVVDQRMALTTLCVASARHSPSWRLSAGKPSLPQAVGKVSATVLGRLPIPTSGPTVWCEVVVGASPAAESAYCQTNWFTMCGVSTIDVRRSEQSGDGEGVAGCIGQRQVNHNDNWRGHANKRMRPVVRPSNRSQSSP